MNYINNKTKPEEQKSQDNAYDLQAEQNDGQAAPKVEIGLGNGKEYVLEQNQIIESPEGT